MSMKRVNDRWREMSNKKLHSTLLQNIRRERLLLTEILHLLLEVEQRRLFCEYKCTSTFDYAVKILGYSEPQAGRRIQAMRLLRAVPEVETKLSNGELSLTTAAQVQQFVNKEERSAIASKGPDKSRESCRFEVEEKRKLVEEVSGLASRQAEQVLLDKSSNPEIHRESAKIIGNKRTELKFSITEKVHEKMKRVQGLLAHSKGKMNLEDFFDELLDVAIERVEKRKALKTKEGVRAQGKDVVRKKHKVKIEEKN